MGAAASHVNGQKPRRGGVASSAQRPLVVAAIPTGGGSLILAAGLLAGGVFVAYTYVASGGKASFDDYYAAFTMGFVVGTTLVSVYADFGVAADVEVAGAGQAPRAAAEAQAATEVEADATRGALADERILEEAPDVLTKEGVAAKTEMAAAAADGGGATTSPADLVSGRASLTKDDIEQILAGEARHSYDRHAAQLKLGFSGKAWRAEGEQWLDLHREVLGNPDRVFGASRPQIGKSIGFFKTIGTEPVVVFLRYDTLEYATTVRPSLFQMTSWGLM